MDIRGFKIPSKQGRIRRIFADHEHGGGYSKMKVYPVFDKELYGNTYFLEVFTTKGHALQFMQSWLDAHPGKRITRTTDTICVDEWMCCWYEEREISEGPVKWDDEKHVFEGV